MPVKILFIIIGSLIIFPSSYANEYGTFIECVHKCYQKDENYVPKIPHPPYAECSCETGREGKIRERVGNEDFMEEKKAQ